jgi:TonB-dependent receptor
VADQGWVSSRALKRKKRDFGAKYKPTENSGGIEMRKFLWSLVLATFALQMLWAVPAGAQAGRGVIAGTVKDSGGSVLSSALVTVQPLGRTAVSDDQGYFRIADLPAGEYEISASYVGFAGFSQKVTVTAGQTATVDPALQVASQNDQVIVTAERVQGEAEAINIERTSDNIVQVLPSRVINSLPNTNIADAVGRVPSVSLERDEGEGKYVQIRGTEPRLSTVTVNGVNVPSVEGVVRNIKLDSVPADLVERIEVYKTLSANQDADGVGGTVNMVTRSAGEKATYNFNGQGGYNPLQGGYTLGEFDGTAGKRFGAEKKLGFILSGHLDKTNRGIDDLEPGQTTGVDPATNNNIAFANTEDFRSYTYYRTRYGFSSGLDYNLKPSSNLYLKGFFSDFHDYGETWVYTPTAGSNIKSVNGGVITFFNCTEANAPAGCTPGNFVYRHYVRRPDQQLYSFLTGGRHDLSSTLITYEFAGSRSHNVGGQDFATTNFNNGPTTDLVLNQTDPLRPKLTPQDNVNVYDPTLYSLTRSSFTNYIATQINFQGAAAVSRRYSAHSHFGTFEVGVKVRNSHSNQNENDKTFNFNSGAPITLSSVLGTYTNPTYYDKFFTINGMAYGPTSNYSKINQAVLANLGNFQEDLAGDLRKRYGALFDANERVYAGYLQNVISLGKFRVQTGVRFDAATTSFQTNSVDVTNPSNPIVTPISKSSSYFNALPSVQVQYQLEKNTNLRGNFSQGIARPNIGDLVPTTIVDPNANPSPGVVTQGNPNLRPTKATNYDILVEHYFQPLGIVQAGFFYKHLSDPIYATTSIIGPGLPNAGLHLQQSVNGPTAHIAGFEATWEQRFSFLPGLLNGFGVAANYSYTSSQVTFPPGFSGGRTDHAPLQRQAPNTWNAGFTYDKSRLSMRFSASHNDTNIAFYNFGANATPNDPILGLMGPTGDTYFYAHTQFDIQGSYRLYKGLQFTAAGLNLSNEVFGFYNGSPKYPIQREFYKPTVTLGMRWTSSPE